MTELARRTSLITIYNNKNVTDILTNYITNWTYTDNLSGEIDDLQITLQDKNDLWLNKWFPKKGSVIKPTLLKRGYQSKDLKTKIGQFEIDTISGGGAPTKITIKALATSEKNSLRGQQKFRSWENATLKEVASDIAKANNMQLYYRTSEKIKKERWDQAETDLKFLYSICKESGLCLKISNKSIVILDEADYEAKDPVATINRKSKDTDKIKLESPWSFNTTLFDIYAACKVKYYNTSKKKTFSATFRPKKVPNNMGRILYINEQVSSNSEAYRLAKKRLREKNKNATTLILNVTSTMFIFAGMTFNLAGFGKLNGKYIATKVIYREHNLTLYLRRCLEGY